MIKLDTENTFISPEGLEKIEKLINDEDYNEWYTNTKREFVNIVFTDYYFKRVNEEEYNHFQKDALKIIKEHAIPLPKELAPIEFTKKDLLRSEKNSLDLKIKEVQLELESTGHKETPYFVHINNDWLDLKRQFEAMMKYSQMLQKRINRL